MPDHGSKITQRGVRVCTRNPDNPHDTAKKVVSSLRPGPRPQDPGAADADTKR